ncbi:MAG: thioredoxin fold domain-containing protein [Ardenticatenales bacterium]|nr:thioredoxin fold domain-containing protein [Ardenticatenales bacterium]
MPTRSLLLLTLTLLMTACGSLPPTTNSALTTFTLDNESNPEALQAAEGGDIGRPTIVFFHARWCQLCQKVRPEVEALADKYEDDVTFIRMDINAADARPSVNRYQVHSTPTFVLLAADGNVLASIPGWPGEEMMELTIQELLNPEQ